MSLAEQRLRTRLDAALRRVYGLRGFESALSEERADMMREVRDQLRPDATSLGIEIDDVRIRRTDLTAEVSQQTFDRMKAERLAEAERLRARGREAAQGIRARPTAKSSRPSPRRAGNRKSCAARAKRSATRSSPRSSRSDPDFFEFYRSMNAYVAALDGQGTTMVLSPDSEFFRFFRNADGQTPAARLRRPHRQGAPHRPTGRRPRRRRRAPTTGSHGAIGVGDFLAAIGLVLVIEGLVYGGFPQLAKKLGDGGAVGAGKHAADRRAGRHRHWGRHRLAGARVTQDLSVWPWARP